MSKYWAIFRTQVQNRLAYAGDLLSQSGSIIVYLWIFVQLWRTTYRAVGQETINGLSLADTVWYLVIAETIVLSKPRLARVISEAVKDGSIAYLLNKPYNFLLYHLSVGFGDGCSNILFNLLAGGTVAWLTVGPPPALSSLPLVLVAIGCGWLIDFCFSAVIGLAAFVSEETSAYEWIYSKIVFILGGLLIPLDFYPEWLRNIALNLPFAYTLYGPARLFIEPSAERFFSLLGGQLAWIAALGLVVALLYRKSISWLVINGG